ncbi:MAG: LytTR family transcriptional regulator DNA-binding domain-containing protein [Bacteroidales bacterium]|jgi:DNA-binding LytR/AlgR family response regulator|nr:LytTR family transcriptional regulator DNA-binding domain-containing protein [Bacteroidales bacterium]
MQNINKLIVPMLFEQGKGKGFQFIDKENIFYLKADNNYTEIYTNAKNAIVASKPLKFFEERLNGMPFVRPHNSYIINSDKLKIYEKGEKGEKGCIKLVNCDVKIPVSRKKEMKSMQIRKFPIVVYEEYHYVDINTILYLEAEGNRTCFKLQDSNEPEMWSTKPLGFYEELLKKSTFFRIHNKHIVNMTKIFQYVRGKDGWLILTTGKGLTVAENKREAFLKTLHGEIESS